MRVEGAPKRTAEQLIAHNCALLGITSKSPTHFPDLIIRGLTAQQHRGQEAAGAAFIMNDQIKVVRDEGLVKGFFSERVWTEGPLPEPGVAIGHTRYPTSGAKSDSANSVQPFDFGEFVIAHNGTTYPRMSILGVDDPTSDTYATGKTIATGKGPFETRVRKALQNLEGAYTFMIGLADGTFYVARDPAGFRPALVGQIPGGIAVASESIGLEKIGATPLPESLSAQLEGNEIPRGTLAKISPSGIEIVWEDPRTGHKEDSRCTFERTYFADATSRLHEVSNHTTRARLGERLAQRVQPQGDAVVVVPESGRSYGEGVAGATGLLIKQAIHVNRYTGRNFIKPESPGERIQAAEAKLNFIPELINGKRLIIVDDSIVRGNTTQGLILELFKHGAQEIHLLSGIPPITSPCYWGIDFKDPQELIYNVLMDDPERTGTFEERLASWLVADKPSLVNRLKVSFQTLEDYREIAGQGCYHCVSGTPPHGTIIPNPKKRH